MSVIPLDVVDKLQRYEKLKLDIKAAELELEGLKEQIIPHIPEGAEVQTEGGSFSLSSKTVWEYSPETVAREKALKETKKGEEATGLAVAKKGEPFIVYRQKKD